MKRRCPNHWTKGTKKPFFIYLSSENRSGSFCFYTQFKISFVFMLAISDVNSAGRPPFLRVPSPTQWHTNHAPSLSPIIKPPDPFIFFFFHPPWISKTPLFRIKKKKKKEEALLLRGPHNKNKERWKTRSSVASHLIATTSHSWGAWDWPIDGNNGERNRWACRNRSARIRRER